MENKAPEMIYQSALARFRQLHGFDDGVFLRIMRDTSEETVVLILQQFTLSLAKAGHELNTMIDKVDELLISRICHKLKGSSELLGFKGFSLELEENSVLLRNSETNEEKWTAVQQLRSAIEYLQSVLESTQSPSPTP